MKRERSLRLFQTLEHGCGYYADKLARNLVVDPLAPELQSIYGQALGRGFRRAGGHLYRPMCRECSLCIPCRVPVARFTPDRAQRRCLRRNSDVSVHDMAPELNSERFELYRRYLAVRHPQGGMDDPTPDDFSRFLLCEWSGSRFLEMRLGQRLLALAVCDRTEAGLSAVYSFFDPDESARGLGTLAVLHQMDYCRQHGLPHLYLGYWLDQHPKMDYKRRFRPLEVLLNGVWQEQTS